MVNNESLYGTEDDDDITAETVTIDQADGDWKRRQKYNQQTNSQKETGNNLNINSSGMEHRGDNPNLMNSQMMARKYDKNTATEYTATVFSQNEKYVDKNNQIG